MSMELAEHNIRVNVVAPAVVERPIHEAFIDLQEMDAVLASFIDFHPAGRIGTPENSAKTVLHL